MCVIDGTHNKKLKYMRLCLLPNVVFLLPPSGDTTVAPRCLQSEVSIKNVQSVLNLTIYL